ncbi:putative MFS transporter [Seiridium cardinale]
MSSSGLSLVYPMSDGDGAERGHVSPPTPKAPPRTGGHGRDIIDDVIDDTSATGNLEPVAPTRSYPAEGAVPPSPQPPSHDHEPARSGSTAKLSRAKTTLTMVSLCLSVLLSALDMTIVVTAVPAIVASLRSVTGYIWVGSAFTLGLTAVTPIWGSVADIWGRKPVILSALAIFLAASVVCAVAPQIDALIVGRAIQGVGAAGMSVMVNTIICDMFSLRERGLYLAITSMVWAIGSAIGPILGGVFTTRLHWRWCFWFNLPIGGVVFIALFFFLSVPSANTPLIAGLKTIDWTGSLLCMGGALMVLLGLDFGDVTHPWLSPTVVCLLVFGVLVIGLFVVNEWKFAVNPIIPLRLLSSRSQAAAYSVFAVNSYIFIGITYYLPLYSQSVLGVDALTSGLHILPLIVSCSLSAAGAGIYIQQTGKYRPIMYAAQALLTLGVGLLINLEFEENLTKLFIFEILTGVGVGLNIEAPVIAAQAATTVRDTAAVVATMSFLRSITTGISVVVGGVMFQNQMNAENADLANTIGQKVAEQFDGGNATGNVELISSLAADQQVMVRQAYFRALRSVWIMYVAVAGIAFVLNIFVSAHPLSRERNDTVLGFRRDQLGSPGGEGHAAVNSVELITIGANDHTQELRNRGR